MTNALSAARPWIKPNQKITDAHKATFLMEMENSGNQQKAADAAGLSVAAFKRCADPDSPSFDPEFAEAWGEAYERFIDGLRDHAVRRATDGWREPIIGGEFRDEIVAYKPVFSDRLLELLLKRHDAAFRDKVTVESTKTTRHVHELDFSAMTPEQRALVRQLIESSGPRIDRAHAIDTQFESIESEDDSGNAPALRALPLPTGESES